MIAAANLPRVCSGLTLAMAAAIAVVSIGHPATADGLASFAILLVGLPHGAFDRLIARTMSSRQIPSFTCAIPFAAIYISIAALVAHLWTGAPSEALILFLALSALHFGLSERGDGPLWYQAVQVVVQGGAPIVLIPAFHIAEVAPIFADLTDRSTAAWVLGGIQGFLPVWLSAAAVYVAAAIARQQIRRVMELAALAVAFAAFAPSLGFLFYFGGVHGPRHMRAAAERLKRHGLAPRAVAAEVVLLSALALAGFVTAFAACAAMGGLDQPQLHRILFIGLAALTVPHMILVDGAALWTPMVRGDAGAEGGFLIRRAQRNKGASSF